MPELSWFEFYTLAYSMHKYMLAGNSPKCILTGRYNIPLLY